MRLQEIYGKEESILYSPILLKLCIYLETRIIDIANLVNEITGNANDVEFVARRDWDKIIKRRASIAKAKKVLGYEPKTEMKDGIKRVYDWIMENRGKIEESARF